MLTMNSDQRNQRLSTASQRLGGDLDRIRYSDRTILLYLIIKNNKLETQRY